MRHKMNGILWVIVLSSVLSGSINAGEKLTVAFGEVMAPWVLASTNEGIVIEIFEAAMGPLGYKVKPLYLPYARRTLAYKNGDIDVVSDMNLNTINQYELEGFFSDTAYSYENFAFSLAKNNYQLEKLSDLERFSILSWQDASIHLGPEYAKMATNNPRYSETFDQSIQVKMLYLERYQIVQMDAQIFDYYRAKLISEGEVETLESVDRFPLFGASPNGFLFKNKELRDKFNVQLKRLKKTQKYAKIFTRHSQVK